MEEFNYAGEETKITMTQSELDSIKEEFYEQGFRTGQNEYEKLNQKFELLKTLFDLVSKSLD